MATFPTGVKQFANSNHIDGIDIAPHINDLQDEVNAIETALKGTIAPAKITTTGGVHVGGTTDPGIDNFIVDGTSTLTGAVTAGGAVTVNGVFTAKGNVVLGDATTETITCTGRLILRTLATNPLDATPANRPAGSLAEIAYFTAKIYLCTDAAVPTWVALN